MLASTHLLYQNVDKQLAEYFLNLKKDEGQAQNADKSQ